MDVARLVGINPIERICRFRIQRIPVPYPNIFAIGPRLVIRACLQQLIISTCIIRESHSRIHGEKCRPAVTTARRIRWLTSGLVEENVGVPNTIRYVLKEHVATRPKSIAKQEYRQTLRKARNQTLCW
jgi:hypothetical protein